VALHSGNAVVAGARQPGRAGVKGGGAVAERGREEPKKAIATWREASIFDRELVAIAFFGGHPAPLRPARSG
jgi:hypothetical protein